MSATDDLLKAIFDGKRPALYAEFAGWVRQSRRFRAFADAYRTKIRAKLINARDADRLQDVRAELATANWLLREKRFTIEYETYAARKQRGPDFTVTFKTHTPFNVEVRRIGGLELADADAEVRSGKLMAVLGDKVGQMPPSIANLLWLVADNPVTEDDIITATTALRLLAESKTEDYFTRRGFESAAHFIRQFRLLSGIVAWQQGACLVWLNPLAKHAAPPDIIRAIQRLEAE